MRPIYVVLKKPRMSLVLQRLQQSGILMKGKGRGRVVWKGQSLTPESAQVQVGVYQTQTLKDMPLLPTTAGPWPRSSGLAGAELIFSLSPRPLEFALGSVLSDWRRALFLFLSVLLCARDTFDFQHHKALFHVTDEMEKFSPFFTAQWGGRICSSQIFPAASGMILCKPIKVCVRSVHVPTQTPPLQRQSSARPDCTDSTQTAWFEYPFSHLLPLCDCYRSVPQFPHLWNEVASNTDLIVLLQRLS